MSTAAVSQSLANYASRRWWHGLVKFLFWLWNTIFLAVMVLGFAAIQVPDLIRSVREGITPVRYLVQSGVLIAIPIVATVIGLLFLRKQPEKLFALGYVVEWPLLLILLFRFFVIREGNPAITTLLVWLAVAEAAFLWYLLDRRPLARTSVWSYARLAGLTLLFSGTLYAAVWLLFYVPPIAAALVDFLKALGESVTFMFGSAASRRWYDVPMWFLMVGLYLISGSLIVVMPVAAPILAGRAWWRSLRAILDGRSTDPDEANPVDRPRSGTRLPAAIAAMLVPLAVVLVVLGLNMRQPQRAAFALLAEPPTTPEQAQRLIEREDEIRAGLLNSYLSSYRYLGSLGSAGFISDMYQSSLKISARSAQSVEGVYERVISPFLYQPAHANVEGQQSWARLQNEQREAAELYERYFDQPIATAERDTIVNAVRSNPESTQVELAWQAVDDREVHLSQQEVTLSEHGDWAEVTLHEVYQNHTPQRQEVVYYFSLPESAAITGLWLGPTANFENAFRFQVAPRGAAQAVYQNEVRYLRDPALVEQIGPRQYRLRAFPVEPRSWNQVDSEYTPGPEMHLWLAYRTLAVDGSWPLPQIAERRNVYWDNKSKRSLNGKAMAGADEDWLPASQPASQAVAASSHRVDFKDGTSVVARPANLAPAAGLPADLRVAVVLDRSFSMRDRAGEVTAAFADLKQALGSAPEPVVYLTASDYRGEAPDTVSLASFEPERVVYQGGQNAAELLAQYEALSAGQSYDLILVLTDGSGYELGDGQIKVSVPDAPLWVVHLGGGFPLGYDDATQQAIQASGGGAAASVNEALARYAVGRDAPGQMDIVDGYAWQTLPSTEAAALADVATSPADGFAALAARRVLLAEMAKHRGQLSELPVLDQLHELAVEQGIVTPYSSMIVLVNQNQQDLLDELKNKDDRFLREVEDIGLTEENFPGGITGVPEPEEWLLLALAAALLAWAWRKKSRGNVTAKALSR